MTAAILPPKNELLATAIPPAVVNDPPLLLLVAAVVLLMDIPPPTIIEPVVLEELTVVFDTVITPLAPIVVKDPVLEVVDPMAPGLANDAPLSELAFRLGTFVVDAITRGAVPVATLEVIAPLTFIVVNDPVLAVVDPIAPGLANVAPTSELALRLGMLVVDEITSGAVPVKTLDVINPLAPMVVNKPVSAVDDPIAPGFANVAPPRELALRFGMFVDDAITSGAVPVASVLVICPEVVIFVNVPPAV